MSQSTAGRRERVASALAPADSGVPLDPVKVADASGFKQTDDAAKAKALYSHAVPSSRRASRGSVGGPSDHVNMCG